MKVNYKGYDIDINNTFKLVDLNGYYGVELEGKVYLIDNGSPKSFLIEKEGQQKEFYVHEDYFDRPAKTYSINYLNWSKEFQLQTFGQEIDGLIGQDRLSSIGSIEVDLINKTVTFYEIKGEYEKEIQLDSRGQYPMVVNGHNLNCFFDIGAHTLTIRGYNNVNNLNCIGSHNEGIANGLVFSFAKYNVDFKLNNESFNIDALLIPREIEFAYTYADCYMCIGCVAKERFAYDFKNNVIKYK